MAAGTRDDPVDLLVIGGGIHGAGIARDAAGRGLSVLLCERDDLASATSSASSKLIHGGLRYLEHGGFRLVREALAEREVLMATAPHLVQPLRFVLPRVAGLRSDWIVRSGLWLYDRMGGPISLPRSKALALAGTPYGAPLRPEYDRAYIYSDCRTDDARLTLANARAAADRGARIETRTEAVEARREGGLWRVRLERRPPLAAAAAPARGAHEVWARSLANAAGPWVERVLTGVVGRPARTPLRLVKGSHIVVPRLYPGAHAYILQQPDRRVVFVIPYEQDFTLIGTTELVQPEPGPVAIAPDEIDYLCAAAQLYLTAPVPPEAVVWSFAGTRALVGSVSVKSASALSRESVLDLDESDGAAPLLSLYGGKLTTYRALAERAVETLRPFHPLMGPAWTADAPLPGGDLETSAASDPLSTDADGNAGGASAAAGARRSATGSGGGGSAARLATLIEALRRAHPELHGDLLAALARRHGSAAHELLAGARVQADLGRWFGGDLFERELEWMAAREWALTADDVLWRRSKAGLRLSAEQRRAVERWMAGRPAGRTETAG